jgi:hypothetical protein
VKKAAGKKKSPTPASTSRAGKFTAADKAKLKAAYKALINKRLKSQQEKQLALGVLAKHEEKLLDIETIFNASADVHKTVTTYHQLFVADIRAKFPQAEAEFDFDRMVADMGTTLHSFFGAESVNALCTFIKGMGMNDLDVVNLQACLGKTYVGSRATGKSTYRKTFCAVQELLIACVGGG